MQITIAVLAGGHSRRMGRDKARIVVDGEALLSRTVRLARETGAKVTVFGRARPDDWALQDVTFRPDTDAGQGPLGGLATALEHAEGRTVLLVACDLPLLTADAITWLIQQGQREEALIDGLITVNGTQREPLFSLYKPGCLALVRRQLAAGRRSVQVLIDVGEFTFVAAPPDIQRALRDVDTPEDLAALFQSPTRSP